MAREFPHVTAQVVFEDDRYMDESGEIWHHNLWNVTLKGAGGFEMETEFRTGMALKEPTAADVLESLFMDAQGVRFEDVDGWISSYGFEIDGVEDVRKYEAMYKKIEAQTEKLAVLVGSEIALAALLDMDADKAAKELTRS